MDDVVLVFSVFEPLNMEVTTACSEELVEQGGGVLGAVGPVFDQKAFLTAGADGPSGAILGFKDADFDPLAVEQMRQGQTGDPGADHGYFHRVLITHEGL